MSKNSQNRKSGQVVTEYIMILTVVVLGLLAAKVKINALGQVDLSGGQGSVTIMEKLSESFSIWMRDMFIIFSLPS